MKAATLRAFLSVHSWMGLLAGMALFIAFYAGAITVFTHALSSWQTTPPATQAAPADPVAAAQTLLDTVIAAHPQVAESFLVLLPGEHGPLARVYWYGPQADASGGMRQYQLSSSGALLELPQRVGFADFLYDLHFTAGLPRIFGTYLFGVVSVLYGLALVSGVVLYAPVFFKDLFALRIGANLKRLWQDAHNVVGMLSLPFHVIFAWSGAVLCLGVLLLAPFQFLVFDGKLLQILEPDFELTPHVAPANRAAPVLPMATLLEKARAASSGFVPESVSYHDAGDANARVEVYGHHDQRQLNTLGGVALEGATGKVLRVLAAHDARRYRGLAWPAGAALRQLRACAAAVAVFPARPGRRLPVLQRQPAVDRDTPQAPSACAAASHPCDGTAHRRCLSGQRGRDLGVVQCRTGAAAGSGARGLLRGVRRLRAVGGAAPHRTRRV